MGAADLAGTKTMRAETIYTADPLLLEIRDLMRLIVEKLNEKSPPATP